MLTSYLPPIDWDQDDGCERTHIDFCSNGVTGSRAPESEIVGNSETSVYEYYTTAPAAPPVVHV